ncbi:MAG: class I SAM-dependent methyltransferase [Chloroflexota bacterium]
MKTRLQKLTNWARLWRELVEGQEAERRKAVGGAADESDFWQGKASEYDATLKRRWAEADPLKGLVASHVDADTTVLDIGAGPGRWAISLAKRARRVTAVEPSPAMLDVLTRNLEEEGVDNVDVVEGWWPDVEVATHDISLCSHSMYGCPDLPAFVARMVAVTRRECFLVLKAPLPDGILAEASNHVWGHPHDCPDFTVAYNVLMEMGILPNALVDPAPWEPWSSANIEEALAKMKKHLRLGGSIEYDEYLRKLLNSHLTFKDGRYIWPKAVRSAMIYWPVYSAQ